MQNIKQWINCNKKKILIYGGGTLIIGTTLLLAINSSNKTSYSYEFIKGILAKKNRLEMPSFDDMECLDWCYDGKNKEGAVVWLADCTINNLEKLKENLLKINGINSDTCVTMLTLWNYNKGSDALRILSF